ncbi:MAG TPA: CPBP family intramembrane metalloprotease [Candidatus Omnitrophota bacterium]|nr:CPBP family intramembrane metalloprotease [Candidatus Omnitrophota bacterium]HPS37533.1 CPBP family intramembrane metalloprotease [Candidatus Omnitrophota bacterium]
MIKEIHAFFKREPRYFWLFLLVLAFYAFLYLGPRPAREGETHAPARKATSLREAEKKWNGRMDRESAFKEFASREPVLAALFEIMTLLIILGLLAGGVFDVIFLTKPALRAQLTVGTDPPPVPQAWPFSMLFKVVILFVVWGILLSLGMGIVQALSPKWPTDNFFMIFHTLILNLICLYFMVRFLKQAGSHWRDLGFHLPAKGVLREIGLGIAGYMGVLPLFALVVAVLLVVAGIFHYEPPQHPLVSVFLEEEKRAPFLFVVSIFLGAVAGPVLEEVFFRGFCYPILRNKWGKVWAMALSAAFFAGIHYSGFVFWPIFVLGMALAVVYEKRRSLVACIALHVTHNTFFIAYFFLVKHILGENAF